MIGYSSFLTPDNKKETEEVLKLIGLTFGEEEEMLERRQLCGEESEYNADYLFTAYEDGKLLGNIHLTVCGTNGTVGCLGGLVTVPEARGKGVATKLFADACECFDKLGGRMLFLGTGNPVAARMYEKFGFRFITGTAIMVRVKDSPLFDVCREMYSDKEYEIIEMNDSCRVPIIPIVADRGRDILMDFNANIINNQYATQNSCTGLYPRFLKIKENGRVMVARLKNGAVAAVLTERSDGEIHNIDCFAYTGFEEALPQMLEKAIEMDRNYSAVICKKDTEKLQLFKSFGFSTDSEYDYEFNNIHIPCYYCVKKK